MTVKTWNELEDRIEDTLFELEVSHDSLRSPIQTITYAGEELTKLRNLIAKVYGSEKVHLIKKRFHYFDVYVAYVISLDKTNNPHDKELYNSETQHLFAEIKAEIHSIKGHFEESTDEAKLEYGDCLLDALLIYHKLSKELYQRPSLEYRATFREVATEINKIREQSKKFLNKLYEFTNGDSEKEIEISAINERLDLNDKELANSVNYLSDKALIELNTDKKKVRITVKGAEAKHQPDKYFMPKITVYGDMTDSNILIQQDSPGAKQELYITKNEKEEILKEIDALNISLKQYGINREQKSDIEDLTNLINEILSKQKPRRNIMTECARSLRNVLEGALGAAIAAELAAKMPLLMKMIEAIN